MILLVFDHHHDFEQLVSTTVFGAVCDDSFERNNVFTFRFWLKGAKLKEKGIRAKSRTFGLGSAVVEKGA